jgi:hypothetical protein
MESGGTGPKDGKRWHSSQRWKAVALVPKMESGGIRLKDGKYAPECRRARETNLPWKISLQLLLDLETILCCRLEPNIPPSPENRDDCSQDD